MTELNTFADRLSKLQKQAHDLASKRAKKPTVHPKPEVAPKLALPDVEDIHAHLEHFASEFEAHLEDGAHSAKEALRNHPIATLASVFVIGLIIGRLSK